MTSKSGRPLSIGLLNSVVFEDVEIRHLEGFCKLRFWTLRKLMSVNARKASTSCRPVSGFKAYTFSVRRQPNSTSAFLNLKYLPLLRPVSARTEATWKTQLSLKLSKYIKRPRCSRLNCCGRKIILPTEYLPGLGFLCLDFMTAAPHSAGQPRRVPQCVGTEHRTRSGFPRRRACQSGHVERSANR